MPDAGKERQLDCRETAVKLQETCRQLKSGYLTVRKRIDSRAYPRFPRDGASPVSQSGDIVPLFELRLSVAFHARQELSQARTRIVLCLIIACEADRHSTRHPEYSLPWPSYL